MSLSFCLTELFTTFKEINSEVNAFRIMPLIILKENCEKRNKNLYYRKLIDYKELTKSCCEIESISIFKLRRLKRQLL